MPVDKDLTGVFLSIRSQLARAVTEIVPPKEIEDVVQETYVRVCQMKSSTNISSPRSFMFKTARNIALNVVNRAESRLVRPLTDEEIGGESSLLGNEPDTLDRACADQEFARFCDAVRQLPVKCRRAFVLKKVYGHSQREIAAILGVTEKTVERHISIGFKRCREMMLDEQRRKMSARVPIDAHGEST